MKFEGTEVTKCMVYWHFLAPEVLICEEGNILILVKTFSLYKPLYTDKTFTVTISISLYSILIIRANMLKICFNESHYYRRNNVRLLRNLPLLIFTDGYI